MSEEARKALEALQQAVDEELERKAKLGQKIARENAIRLLKL